MNNEARQAVQVVDINMPFMSMVRFMVKWTIASIPALIILAVLAVVFWTVVGGFFAGMGGMSRKTADVNVSTFRATCDPGSLPPSTPVRPLEAS